LKRLGFQEAEKSPARWQAAGSADTDEDRGGEVWQACVERVCELDEDVTSYKQEANRSRLMLRDAQMCSSMQIKCT
jgi:hypothetical protein